MDIPGKVNCSYERPYFKQRQRILDLIFLNGKLSISPLANHGENS